MVPVGCLNKNLGRRFRIWSIYIRDFSPNSASARLVQRRVGRKTWSQCVCSAITPDSATKAQALGSIPQSSAVGLLRKTSAGITQLGNASRPDLAEFLTPPTSTSRFLLSLSLYLPRFLHRQETRQCLGSHVARLGGKDSHHPPASVPTWRSDQLMLRAPTPASHAENVIYGVSHPLSPDASSSLKWLLKLMQPGDRSLPTCSSCRRSRNRLHCVYRGAELRFKQVAITSTKRKTRRGTVSSANSPRGDQDELNDWSKLFTNPGEW